MHQTATSTIHLHASEKDRKRWMQKQGQVRPSVGELSVASATPGVELVGGDPPSVARGVLDSAHAIAVGFVNGSLDGVRALGERQRVGLVDVLHIDVQHHRRRGVVVGGVGDHDHGVADAQGRMLDGLVVVLLFVHLVRVQHLRHEVDHLLGTRTHEVRRHRRMTLHLPPHCTIAGHDQALPTNPTNPACVDQIQISRSLLALCLETHKSGGQERHLYHPKNFTGKL